MSATLQDLKLKMRESFLKDNVQLQEALFVMGFTGEGKTLICHLFAKNQLGAKEASDEDNAMLLIQPINSDDPRKIAIIQDSTTEKPNLFLRIQNLDNQNKNLSNSEPQEDFSQVQSSFSAKNGLEASQITEGQDPAQEANQIEFGFRRNELGDQERVSDNKHEVQFIWDTAGFQDTKTNGQEILNQFYICLLLKNVEKAKFLIVTSEQSILTAQQRIFKDTIESFTQMFNVNYLNHLENSVALLVNKVHKLNTPKKVAFAIKKLLNPEDQSLSPQAKQILSYTMKEEKLENGNQVWHPKSIHVFKEIVEEGQLNDDNGLYQNIQDGCPEFFQIRQFQAESGENIANMVITPQAVELAQELLKDSEENFNKLFANITDYDYLISFGLISSYALNSNVSKKDFIAYLVKRAKKQDKIIDASKMEDPAYQDELWEIKDQFQQVMHFDDISRLQTIIENILKGEAEFKVIIEQTNLIFKLFLENSITQEKDEQLILLRKEIMESIQFIQFLEIIKYIQNQETKYLDKIDRSVVRQKFQTLSEKLLEQEKQMIQSFEIKEDLENYDLFSKFHQILNRDRYQIDNQNNDKRGETLIQLSFIKRQDPIESCGLLLESLQALKKVDKTIPDRMIKQICDFVTEDHQHVNIFIDFKEDLFQRIFDELQARMSEMTYRLVSNVIFVCRQETLQSYNQKSHLKQMRAVIQVRNRIHSLQQIQAPAYSRPAPVSARRDAHSDAQPRFYLARDRLQKQITLDNSNPAERCSQVINQFKDIEVFLSGQVRDHNLLSQELKREFDANTNWIQSRIEKLLKALNFMNLKCELQNQMFKWMELFKGPMRTLEAHHKTLIKTIPCGLDNEAYYTKSELIEVCKMCQILPCQEARTTSAQTAFCLGQIFVTESIENPNKRQHAIYYYQKAIEFDNGMNQARLKVAKLLFKSQNYEQAAIRYMELRAYTKLMECHELMIKKDPDDPQLRVNYGQCLRDLGLLPEAKMQYMSAIGLHNLQLNATEASKLFKVVNDITTQQGAPTILFEQQAIDPDSIYPKRNEIQDANQQAQETLSNLPIEMTIEEDEMSLEMQIDQVVKDPVDQSQIQESVVLDDQVTVVSIVENQIVEDQVQQIVEDQAQQIVENQAQQNVEDQAQQNVEDQAQQNINPILVTPTQQENK